MLVKDLAAMNPNWDKITLAQVGLNYHEGLSFLMFFMLAFRLQEAKKIIAAIIQQITYREFLPVILDAKYMNRFNLALMEQVTFTDHDSQMITPQRFL